MGGARDLDPTIWVNVRYDPALTSINHQRFGSNLAWTSPSGMIRYGQQQAGRVPSCLILWQHHDTLLGACCNLAARHLYRDPCCTKVSPLPSTISRRSSFIDISRLFWASPLSWPSRCQPLLFLEGAHGIATLTCSVVTKSHCRPLVTR